MKVDMEFVLPEDRSQLEAAGLGMNLAIFQWDLEQWIRHKLKHGELTNEQDELITELLEWFVDNEVKLRYFE